MSRKRKRRNKNYNENSNLNRMPQMEKAVMLESDDNNNIIKEEPKPVEEESMTEQVEQVKTEQVEEKVEEIRLEARTGYKLELGKETTALDIREREYPVSVINQMLDNQNKHWETICDFFEAKLISRGLITQEQYEQIENEVLGEIAYLSKKYS